MMFVRLKTKHFERVNFKDWYQSRWSKQKRYYQQGARYYDCSANFCNSKFKLDNFFNNVRIAENCTLNTVYSLPIALTKTPFDRKHGWTLGGVSSQPGLTKIDDPGESVN